jgi:hypothetical protein
MLAFCCKKDAKGLLVEIKCILLRSIKNKRTEVNTFFSTYYFFYFYFSNRVEREVLCV